MKRRIVLLAAVLAALVLVILFWPRLVPFFTSQGLTPQSAAQNIAQKGTSPATALASEKISAEEAAHSLQQQEAQREKKVMDLLLLTPISFYGRVIDERQNPIEGAIISISFVDSLDEGKSHTKDLAKTDSDGRFHISGHGMAAIINASKVGYYRVKESGGVFGYSKEGGRMDPHPDAASPAIFILRKMGNPVPLIKLNREYSISKDGKPVEISLTTGRVVQNGQGDLRVEAWTNDQGYQANSNVPYDWHCSVSVPGGGLLLRQDEFDFEAPDAIYPPSDVIEMPTSIGAQWRSQVTRQYFVKLAGNRYALLEFEMTAGGDHFFGVKSYVNPTPGDRNLEADTGKTLPLQ